MRLAGVEFSGVCTFTMLEEDGPDSVWTQLATSFDSMAMVNCVSAACTANPSCVKTRVITRSNGTCVKTRLLTWEF